MKLITVMCDGDDGNIKVNYSLKSEVLTAEEESDIELISTEHAHFIRLDKSVAAVEKASGAKVKFLENAVSGVGRALTNDKILCHMVGKATERQRAWALIKAVLTVSQDGNELERLIQHQDNDLVAQAAILENRNAIHFVSAQLRGSVGFNMMMLSSFPFDEALLLVLESDSSFVELLSNEFQTERVFVHQILQRNSFFLQYASAELKDDIDIVKVAVQRDLRAVEFASEAIRDNWARIEAIQNDWTALEFASESICNREDILRMAVQNDGRSLKFASARIQNDFSIVKRAVQQSGIALQFATEALRGNEEIVNLQWRSTVLLLSLPQVAYEAVWRSSVLQCVQIGEHLTMPLRPSYPTVSS